MKKSKAPPMPPDPKPARDPALRIACLKLAVETRRPIDDDRETMRRAEAFEKWALDANR